MTISELLSKSEFWAALFGALAAFLLGALATWRAGVNAKRTAGNMAIVTLGQMCSLMENLRRQLLVDAPILAREKCGGSDPFSWQVLSAFGLPAVPPRLVLQDLGFLADSRDPDILNRLLTVERAFECMLEVVRRHEQLHIKLQERMNEVDPSGQKPFYPEQLVQVVGAKMFIEVDLAYEALQSGLPDARDRILDVSRQLREILRLQFPTRRFLLLVSAHQSRITDQHPPLPKAAIWRRATRATVDRLTNQRTKFARLLESARAASPEPVPPPVRKFPPRSWD
jgi:hypothetical protein